jgi:hypothetical protein
MDEERALYFAWAKNEGLTTHLDPRNVQLRSIVQQRLKTGATVAEILPQAYCNLVGCRILVRKSGRETTCI